MKKYNDKEINRLLAEADNLLADIQLYETPEEERQRKEKEEELRKQEERRQEEELRKRAEARQEEELRKQAETRQEETLRQQKENHRLVEVQPETAVQQSDTEEQTAGALTEEQLHQEEMEQQIDLHQLEALGEEEALRRLEAIRRQEAILQQEEARQLKRVRWRELNGQGDALESQEELEAEGTGQQREDSSRIAEPLKKDGRSIECSKREVDISTGNEKPEKENQMVSKRQEPEESAVSDPYRGESQTRIERQWEEFIRSREEQRKETSMQQMESKAFTEEGQEPELAASGRIEPPVRLWLNMLFIVISMIYLEVLTHTGIVHEVNTTIIYPILFAAGFGCVITVIASFLSKQWNTVIVCTVLILGSLYCDLQMLYHAVAGTFLNLTRLPEEISFLFRDGDALFQGMMDVLPFLLFMFLPILLWVFVGREWIRFGQSTWLKRLLIFVFGCILTVVSILCLDLHGYEENSPYVCAYRFDSDTLLEPAGEQLGMTAMTILELLELVK